MRRAAGLDGKLELSPSKKVFYKLAAALECAQLLQENGAYSPSQIGVFARDLGRSGAKTFYVSTYAGIALEGCRAGGQHWYEVFEQHRPCWLYFDIERSKDVNGELDRDRS